MWIRTDFKRDVATIRKVVIMSTKYITTLIINIQVKHASCIMWAKFQCGGKIVRWFKLLHVNQEIQIQDQHRMNIGNNFKYIYPLVELK